MKFLTTATITVVVAVIISEMAPRSTTVTMILILLITDFKKMSAINHIVIQQEILLNLLLPIKMTFSTPFQRLLKIPSKMCLAPVTMARLLDIVPVDLVRLIAQIPITLIQRVARSLTVIALIAVAPAQIVIVQLAFLSE